MIFFSLISNVNGGCHQRETTQGVNLTSSILSVEHAGLSADSCQGKCGTSQELPCSCDVTCVVYDNCCLDIEEFCPGLSQRGRRLFPRQVEAGVRCQDGYFLVSTCPENSANRPTPEMPDFESIEKCNINIPEDLILKSFWKIVSQAPVTEISTGINYLNFSIYSCFSRDLSDYVLFDSAFSATKFVSLTSLKQFVSTLSFQIVKHAPHSEKMASRTSYHKNYRCFKYFKDTCDEKYFLKFNTNEVSVMKEKCSSNFSFVVEDGEDRGVYKNKYCALCNSKENNTKPVKNPLIISSSSKYIFSVYKHHVDLTYEYGQTGHMDNEMAEYGSWTKAVCSLPSDEKNSEDCHVIKCSINHVMRPSGICARAYGLGIGFLEDEYPISSEQIKHIGDLIRCHLDYLDLDHRYVFKPFIYQYSKRLERVFMGQIIFYSDRLLTPSATDQKTIYLVSKVLQLAKRFKFYRMRVAEMKSNTSDEIHLRSKKKTTFMHIRKPENFHIEQVESIIRHLNENKGPAMKNLGTVQACICHSLMRRYQIQHDCYLICFHDNIFKEDLEALNSSNICIERFLIRRTNLDTKSAGQKHVCEGFIIALLFLFIPMLF